MSCNHPSGLAGATRMGGTSAETRWRAMSLDGLPDEADNQTMIARTWHGRVPAAQTDNYYAYLQRTGLADYRGTPGNLGILVQTWTEGDVSHFLITTLWESVDAIRRFAGDDYEVARYYPEDDDYLLEREARVSHSTVLMAAMPSPAP